MSCEIMTWVGERAEKGRRKEHLSKHCWVRTPCWILCKTSSNHDAAWSTGILSNVSNKPFLWDTDNNDITNARARACALPEMQLIYGASSLHVVNDRCLSLPILIKDTFNEKLSFVKNLRLRPLFLGDSGACSTLAQWRVHDEMVLTLELRR